MSTQPFAPDDREASGQTPIAESSRAGSEPQSPAAAGEASPLARGLAPWDLVPSDMLVVRRRRART
jgi:hypothetical protein